MKDNTCGKLIAHVEHSYAATKQPVSFISLIRESSPKGIYQS